MPTTGKLYLGSTLLTPECELPPEDGWVRNPNWLPMPELVVGVDQKIVLLGMVWDNGGNGVALTCFGAYTVNWGDGVTENFASAATAQHIYTYSSISDLTEFAYEGTTMVRQVIVTITPQVGKTLVGFTTREYNTTVATAAKPPWLDVAICAASCSYVAFGGDGDGYSAPIATPIFLERVNIISSGDMVNTESMFDGCISLMSVSLFNTSNVTNSMWMFQGCVSLLKVPLFNLSKVRNSYKMFNGCSNLLSVPLFNLSSLTDGARMFQGCVNLRSVPLFNFSTLQDISDMFNGCVNLRSVPLFNLSNTIIFSNVFLNCKMLLALPAFDASKSISFTNAFAGCGRVVEFLPTGIKSSFSITGMNLSASALNTVYTNLASGVSGKTITASGNYGYAASNKTIATAKGWTVN